MTRVAPRVLLDRSRQSKRTVRASTSPHRSARQLREREIDEISNRYLETHNIREVARELGISRTTVAKHLSARGIGTSRKMTDADIDAAVHLYEQGLGSAQIGERLGFDNHTILKALRKSGIKIRPAVAAGATKAVPASRSHIRDHARPT